MRTESQRASDKRRNAERSRANKAKGLTARGTKPKGTHKPNAKQKQFVVGHKRKQPAPKTPPKNETHAERRARGAALRGTPMARRLDESVAKRIREME